MRLKWVIGLFIFWLLITNAVVIYFTLQPPVGEKRILEAYNVTFYLPESPWHELEARPPIQIAMKREQPEIWFILHAEKHTFERSLDSRALARVSQGQTKDTWTSVDFQNQRNETYNGLPGVVYESNGIAKGQASHKMTWVAARNGFEYQLLAVGPKSATPEIDRVLVGMCQRFRQTEPELVSRTEGIDGSVKAESNNR